MALLETYARTADMILFRYRFCPKGCGLTLFQKDIKTHLEDQCSLRAASCTDGCGEVVLGNDLEAHIVVCPMGLLLTRAESGLREGALKEVKRAIEGAYEERARAYARIEARGGTVLKKGKSWPSERCTRRVANIEAETRELTTRMRRRCREQLTLALQQCDGGQFEDGRAASKGPLGQSKNALASWDAVTVSADSQAANLGSRPWYLAAPAFESLTEALHEAAVCCAEERLRRLCENRLLSMARQVLQAALETEDHTTLTDTIARVSSALKAIELEGFGEVPRLLREAENAVHHASLKSVGDSEPQFFDALRQGDLPLCELLLKHERANPLELDPKSGLPLVVLAAKAGDIPMCRLLLEHRADVNARCDSDGLSALHWVAHWRHARTAKVLLEGRANPRLKDWRGQDALMKLLRRSIDAPAVGCEWNWDVRPQREPMPGPELAGSDVMDVESAKHAAEMDPTCTGFCYCAEDVQPGAKPYVSLRGGASGSTAMAPSGAGGPGEESDALGQLERSLAADGVAGWAWYVKLPSDALHDVRMLFAAGADGYAQDDGGLSALHHHLLSAPCRGSLEVVSTLLRHAADVNHRCSTDRRTTPFLLAVAAKRADLVKLMLREAFPPPDIDAATADGTSALALAEQKHARDVVRILREAGAVEWSGTEFVLGAKTHITFDSRQPVRT